jgi:hypothetical protein
VFLDAEEDHEESVTGTVYLQVTDLQLLLSPCETVVVIMLILNDLFLENRLARVFH